MQNHPKNPYKGFEAFVLASIAVVLGLIIYEKLVMIPGSRLRHHQGLHRTTPWWPQPSAADLQSGQVANILQTRYCWDCRSEEQRTLWMPAGETVR